MHEFFFSQRLEEEAEQSCRVKKQQKIPSEAMSP